jgi:hypothetical protein
MDDRHFPPINLQDDAASILDRQTAPSPARDLRRWVETMDYPSSVAAIPCTSASPSNVENGGPALFVSLLFISSRIPQEIDETRQNCIVRKRNAARACEPAHRQYVFQRALASDLGFA